MVQRCNQVIIIQEQGVGANHSSKYKQDAARRGRCPRQLRGNALTWLFRSWLPLGGKRVTFVHVNSCLHWLMRKHFVMYQNKYLVFLYILNKIDKIYPVLFIFICYQETKISCRRPITVVPTLALRRFPPLSCFLTYC